MYNLGPKKFIAGEDLSDRRLVKIESGTVTDPPEVVYADAGEDAIGVTEAQADDGDPIAVRLLNDSGSFEIECLVDSAIARGASLYVGDDGMVTDASSGSVLGIAAEVGADNAHIEVLIDNRKPTTAAGTTLADAGGLTDQATVEAVVAEMLPKIPVTIADPGDGGAIPVTRSGQCALTTTGVDDTRTLAIPTFAGQEIDISLDVDAGDAVITVAAAVNQTGNNTLTGADAGDHIRLTGVQVAGALVWRVCANDGFALSTV